MKGIRDSRTAGSPNSPTRSILAGLGIPEKRVEVASPHYFEKLPILPGSCQFTDFGDECSTIFNFKCEGRAPRTGHLILQIDSQSVSHGALIEVFSKELDLFE